MYELFLFTQPIEPERLHSRNLYNTFVNFQAEETVIYSCSDKALIGLVCLFVGLYVGMEFGVMNYLTAFVVKGPIEGLTKAEGTRLMAIYLAPFAISRYRKY